VAALVLGLLSILSNLEWATLPFSFYGLRGRSGVLYGDYTLLQTFSFHPSGWIWWALLGLEVFATLMIAADAAPSDLGVAVSIFVLPGIGILSLDAYIAYRWGTLELWRMYVLGAVPALLLLGSGACYTKSRRAHDISERVTVGGPE
jgi:hypothetical protein